jgi:tetratricopeptide (TPR) repeat protein
LDIKKINELGQLATRKMDSGDVKGALGLARQIKEMGSHYAISYVASGILIDAGNALDDEEIVREGFALLEKDFEAIICHKEIAPAAYYNLANSKYVLSRFRITKDPYVVCFKETDLNKAIRYYKKALDFEPENAMFASQIWVNLGNCYDYLGRVVDALECYDQASKLKPDHAMALGNKGIALLNYASVAGEHEGTFIIEAYSLLTQALTLGVPQETINSFSEYIKHIREHFQDKRALDNPPKYPGYRIRSRSKIEKFFVEFCLRNKLYLNICDFCQKCDAAIGDTAVIRTMIVKVNKRENADAKNDAYLHLSGYLHQIKEDYVTTRFLLILSRFKGLNLDFVDKRVRIINTFDHSIHNIHVHLVRTSFKVFYDILDKIACFINEYLNLGVAQRDVSFRRIWYVKNRNIRERIVNTKNLGLNALFDLHRDFEDGPYKTLRITRDALTHRFINIRMIQQQQDEENMTENELVKRTLELARAVRNAVIYLLHFVYIEETKKKARIEGPLLRLFAKDVPNYSKDC